MGGYSFVALNRTSYSGYNLGDDVQGPGLYSHVSVYDPHSMGYMTSKFSKATVTHHYSNSLYLQDMVEFNEQWKVLAALRYDFSVICPPALQLLPDDVSMRNIQASI